MTVKSPCSVSKCCFIQTHSFSATLALGQYLAFQSLVEQNKFVNKIILKYIENSQTQAKVGAGGLSFASGQINSSCIEILTLTLVLRHMALVKQGSQIKQRC